MPPEAPREVATLIESTLVYQNAANYEMAIKTLEEARDLWRRITPDNIAKVKDIESKIRQAA